MIKLITFDLDNTLWDTDPVILRAEQACWDHLAKYYGDILQHFDKVSLRKLKFELADEIPALAHKVSEIRTFCIKQALLRAGYDELTAEQGSRDAFDVFFEERQQVTLYDDAMDTLQALKQRYRLGALTNGNASVALQRLGVFEFGYNAEDYPAAKPAPDLFHAALATTGLTPQEVLHVGDHQEHDVFGAHQCGMQTAWYNPSGKVWSRDDCQPTYQLENLRQLTEIML
jgi:putative hydrolase of the HAD superfamily